MILISYGDSREAGSGMIDLRKLKQFVAVAEELHFHRAAARLNMSQPPLTAAIRMLEEELGGRLLIRGNRVVELTPAGETLLHHARETIRQAERAVEATRDAASGQAGRLRMTYVGSAMYGRLAGVIRTFRRAYPKVHLELKEATTSAQVAALRKGRTDLAILHVPLADSRGLRVEVFDEDRLAIAVPMSHELAQRDRLSLSDLSDAPFVIWPSAEGQGFHHHVVKLCVAAGFVPRIVQEAHQMHGVLSLVAVEMGVAIVPASMTGFRRDEIRYTPISEEGAAFELGICWPEAPVTEIVRNFLCTAHDTAHIL